MSSSSSSSSFSSLQAKSQEYSNPAFQTGDEGTTSGRVVKKQNKNLLFVQRDEDSDEEGEAEETVGELTSVGKDVPGRRRSSVVDVAFAVIPKGDSPAIVQELRDANLMKQDDVSIPMGSGQKFNPRQLEATVVSYMRRKWFVHPFGNPRIIREDGEEKEDDEEEHYDPMQGDSVGVAVWAIFCLFMVGVAGLIIFCAGESSLCIPYSKFTATYIYIKLLSKLSKTHWVSGS